MKLKFYKYAAEPMRINKEKYIEKTGPDIDSVTFTEECNLMNPSFILNTQTHVYNSNYVYCDFTQRYYYIDTIDTAPGGRVILRCSIDVLFTYRKVILDSPAWIEVAGTRDESDRLMKNNFPFREDVEILGKDFPSNPLDVNIGSGSRCIYMQTLC